ncbi:MAG TPA: phosphatidylglycerophosphatase A [Pseudomonadales bacterium]
MSDRPVIGWRQWRDPELLIVCGLGSGFAPKAPGTVGSLAAVLIWWLLMAGLPVEGQLAVIALVTVAGTWLTARVQRRYGVSDPAAIVVDEFAGQWLALLAVPADPWIVLASFALFRLFDIVKPWPVGMLERRVGGAFGVMVDDLAAGLMALAVLQFTLYAIAHV